MPIPEPCPPTTPLAASGRARIGSCPGVRVVATGSYVPPTIVTNEDLAELGCDSEWIIQRTGIRERRNASADQASSDLGYEAALKCLEAANLTPSDIDLLVVATITSDHLTPSTACLLQSRLGITAPAFDVNAACSGFMYALVTGAQFVRTGASRNALIIGSEVMSRTVDPRDKTTYPLFGDGAGAVVLSPTGNNANNTNGDDDATKDTGLLAFSLGSEGVTEALYIPGGGSREPLTANGITCGQQFLHMDGRSVFKWAVRIVVDTCNDVLEAAGYSASDVDLVVLHQANVRIVDAAISHFSIDKDKVFVNLDRYGNTSAASIPLALDDAHRQGKVKRGDLVLLCGFGAGLSWGTALVRW